MRIRRYGARALLVELDDPVDPAHPAEAASASAPGELARWLRDRPGLAQEVVPGARTVLLAGVDDVGEVERLLAGWTPGGERSPAPVVELPVRYDGPDLADVARRWGMTVREAVATHAAVELTVAFCGFAPGFPYLAGLPAELAVPRLDSPRSRVPAGAVGIADAWTGVYPTGSPGGWRLLGRTEVTLWEPDRDPPALLAPGTRVRIVVET